MSLEIRIDASEIERALDELDSKASADAVKKALRKGVNFLKPKVKAAAPKGPTGNLRKKVGVRVRRSRRDRDDYYGVVTSFARHRHLVIDGTNDRYTKAGAFRGRMTPNPFVSQVADANEDQALRIAEEELARQLGLT